MNWGVYVYVFFLAHIKFLFAASIAEATTNLSFLEILISSTSGALFCFNVSFFAGKFIFFKNNTHSKSWGFFKNNKKSIKKRNRIIIGLKNSKLGYISICFLAPLFLTIPIGTFIVVKFYGSRKLTYWIVSFFLIFLSCFLSFLNHFIFH